MLKKLPNKSLYGMDITTVFLILSHGMSVIPYCVIKLKVNAGEFKVFSNERYKTSPNLHDILFS